jgi:alpha-beta hydrolase superfamily lysophospholipase
MVPYSDYLPAKDSDHQLYFTLFHPEAQQAKATLLVLHGMQEHSGRYTDFANFLAEQGFAVLLYDHLGHGKTAKNEAELGFFHHKTPDRQVIQDALTMASHLEKQYPAVPHFLMGHSMGSFIARRVLQQAADRFHGAIIMGTGTRNLEAQLAGVYLFLLNKIKPAHRSSFVNNLFSKMNNKAFQQEPAHSGTNWLSVDENNRENFLQDKLCGVPFTNNGFHTLLSLNVEATRKGWANNIPKEFPLLFISGANDPIGNFGKGVESIVKELRTEGFKAISIRLYPGMRHEILNEGIKQQVYHDLQTWLQEYL